MRNALILLVKRIYKLKVLEKFSKGQIVKYSLTKSIKYVSTPPPFGVRAGAPAQVEVWIRILLIVYSIF